MKAIKIVYKGKEYYSIANPFYADVEEYALKIKTGEYQVVLRFREGNMRIAHSGYDENKRKYLNSKYFGEEYIMPRGVDVFVSEISFYKGLSLKWPELYGTCLRSCLMRKKMIKKVHINGDEAALLWFFEEGSLKGAPAFGTDYYPINQLPKFIQNHINAGNYYI